MPRSTTSTELGLCLTPLGALDDDSEDLRSSFAFLGDVFLAALPDVTVELSFVESGGASATVGVLRLRVGVDFLAAGA